MTKLLDKALNEIQRLPEEEQDFYAQVLLDTLKSEQRWDELFADPRSEQALEQLADEAMREVEAGLATELNAHRLLEDCERHASNDSSVPASEPKR